MRRERGSATIVGVAVLACILLLTAAVVSVTSALVVKQRVVAAADAAALAAADTAAGFVAGEPCALAGEAARLDGAALSSCRVDGLVATVQASGSALGLPVTVWARAGPPGTRDE